MDGKSSLFLSGTYRSILLQCGTYINSTVCLTIHYHVICLKDVFRPISWSLQFCSSRRLFAIENLLWKKFKCKNLPAASNRNRSSYLYMEFDLWRISSSETRWIIWNKWTLSTFFSIVRRNMDIFLIRGIWLMSLLLSYI